MSSWTLCGLCGLCVLFLIGSAAASDVPFVFDEKTSGASGYTSLQIEQVSASSSDLKGVPSITQVADNEILAFPVVGGGNNSEGTAEKKVSDFKELFNHRVEPDNSKVHEKALLLTAKHPGDYTIDQVSAIYSYLKSGDGSKSIDGWSYVSDPRGVNNFFWANETLNLGEKTNCAGVGDCGDFAILMSALVESIGGTTRIILVQNNSTGNHAYAEVYLGRLNASNSQVDSIINWLKQQFDVDKIFVTINTSSKDVWLNLDWSADHPGGPFYQGYKQIVLYIRENYPKYPLKSPEKANKPPKLISLTSDKPSPQDVGTAIAWTAKAKDPENDQIFYRFFLNDDPVTKWIADNTWVWNTTNEDVGENQIEVHVRDGKHAGPDGFDDHKVDSFNITTPETKPITTTNVTRPSQAVPALATAPAPINEAHAESWQKTFRGSGEGSASSVQQTIDGGYIIAGDTKSSGARKDDDAWLIKTDASGNKLWDKTFGGSEGSEAKSVQQTSDGGYIIAGEAYLHVTWHLTNGETYVIGGGNPWLIKTDASGNELWDRTFGKSKDSIAYSVQQTSDGGYIIAGDTASSYSTGGVDAWLIKTDSSGNKEWNRTFGGDDAKSVQQTSDGGYVIAGLTESSAWLIKTDASGNELWDRTFGWPEYNMANSVQQTNDGGYIIAGDTDSNGTSGVDAWLIKTDSSGNKEWNSTLDESTIDQANSVQQTNDGGYIIAGYNDSHGTSDADAWLIKTDASGNKLWDRTFGGSGNDEANSVQQTSDGGYIIAGYTYSFGKGGSDAWLIKTDANGN